MLVTWAYKPRNTLIQRLDPRARLIFTACAMLAVILVWDLRWLLAWLAFALLTYRAARLTWKETRRFWLVVLPLITFLVLITALTGRGGEEAYQTTHPLFTLAIGPWRWVISVEQVVFAAAQFARMLTLATLGLLIPFTIHPAHYGVAFRGLGLNDKFAVATDLAFRLVPSVARDFQTTLDAQRARGYELERKGAGLIRQIRNLAPLIVPVTIQAILNGEDIIDAMDLRAFGAKPRRTWLVELRYRPADYALIALGLLVLGGTLAAKAAGYGAFWVPPALLGG